MGTILIIKINKMKIIRKIIDWFLYDILGRKKLNRWQKQTLARIKAKERRPEWTFTKFQFPDKPWMSIKLSKKFKLPKIYWRKKQSKYLNYRLRAKHKNHINQLVIN